MNTTPMYEVLVVDDAHANLDLIASILEPFYQVTVATSGARALALLGSAPPPDLILLDVLMPGMDGYQVCDAIKQNPALANIPIIFLTSLDDASSESRALATGAADFIHKPINSQVLQSRVSLQLSLVQNRKELENLNQKLHQSLVEVKRARDDLKIFETVIQQSPTSILITDRNGAIEYVNPFFENNTGFALDEVRHQLPRALQSGLSDNRVNEALWRQLSAGLSWSGELVNRRKNGELYREEAHIAPVKNADGAVTNLVAVQLDITERHRAQQELVDARLRELDLGATIQKELLFGELPARHDNLDVAAFTQPSQVVNGDFYTFTRIDDDCVEMLVGDVMGKGMSAAMVGAGVKVAYRELFNELLLQSPQRAVPEPAALVNALHARVSPKLIGLGMFVTLILARVNWRDATITWVNAGHNPLVVRSAAGAVREVAGDNLPVGVLPDEHYQQTVTRLERGDFVLLYSDGLTEVTDASGAQLGIDGLKRYLAGVDCAALGAARVLNLLSAKAVSFGKPGEAVDDMTLLGVGIV